MIGIRKLHCSVRYSVNEYNSLLVHRLALLYKSWSNQLYEVLEFGFYFA